MLSCFSSCEDRSEIPQEFKNPALDVVARSDFKKLRRLVDISLGCLLVEPVGG